MNNQILLKTLILCTIYMSMGASSATVPNVDHSVRQENISNKEDPNTDTFAEFLYHNDSDKYYAETSLPTIGSCGKFMLLYKDEEHPKYAKCECFKWTNNAGRPLTYWKAEKRCYYSYEQGPCKNGEWLVSTKQLEGECQHNPLEGECQHNPCPLGTPTNDGYDSQPLDFYFTDTNGNCFKTNTTGFCPDKNERVFFIGTISQPICSESDPPVWGGSPAFSKSIPCPKGTKLDESDNGCAKVASFGN